MTRLEREMEFSYTVFDATVTVISSITIVMSLKPIPLPPSLSMNDEWNGWAPSHKIPSFLWMENLLLPLAFSRDYFCNARFVKRATQNTHYSWNIWNTYTYVKSRQHQAKVTTVALKHIFADRFLPQVGASVCVCVFWKYTSGVDSPPLSNNW